jgi:hypothetical protein
MLELHWCLNEKPSTIRTTLISTITILYNPFVVYIVDSALNSRERSFLKPYFALLSPTNQQWYILLSKSIRPHSRLTWHTGAATFIIEVINKVNS